VYLISELFRIRKKQLEKTIRKKMASMTHSGQFDSQEN